MAKASGVSPSTVGRIWARHGLKPHRVKSFKLSNDKHFEEKLHDIVGLYLSPPEHAVVFSCDEKSQIQALDRTQPGLPLKKGRCGTMTHDYKRNGTTSLFAALEIATGNVIGTCMDKHRHEEWLKFLRLIERSVLRIRRSTSSATTMLRTSMRRSKPGSSAVAVSTFTSPRPVRPG